MSAKELNIGDYVRVEIEGLSIQRICKIIKIMSDDFFYTDIGYFDKENIIKSSPNIIDLIQVGDYVNGDRVKALKGDIESHKINNEDDVIYTEYINDYDEWCGFEEDEIKSIVTKEQFESMEYKIGEKENER